jgi:hypothetical protein
MLTLLSHRLIQGGRFVGYIVALFVEVIGFVVLMIVIILAICRGLAGLRSLLNPLFVLSLYLREMSCITDV